MVLPIPKKAIRCLGLTKPLISPISAINVIAVNSPIPGIESIRSIFLLISSGELLELIRDSISLNRFFIST